MNKKRIGDGDKQKQEDVENGVAACPPAAIEHGAESNAAEERGKLKRRARRKSGNEQYRQKAERRRRRMDRIKISHRCAPFLFLSYPAFVAAG